MSDLVGNPKDLFSRMVAHIVLQYHLQVSVSKSLLVCTSDCFCNVEVLSRETWQISSHQPHQINPFLHKLARYVWLFTILAVLSHEKMYKGFLD